MSFSSMTVRACFAILAVALASAGCSSEEAIDAEQAAPEMNSAGEGEPKASGQAVKAGCLCKTGCDALPAADMDHGIVLFGRTDARATLHLRYFPEGTEVTGAQGDYLGAAAKETTDASFVYDGFAPFDPLTRKPAPLAKGVADHFGDASLEVDAAVLGSGEAFEKASSGDEVGEATVRLRSGKSLVFSCVKLGGD